MSIEMPNFFEAAGIFDGDDPPTNPSNPIFASNGVLPFDPATTPSDLKGGFTRLDTAQYIVQLVRQIDSLEAVVFVTCFPSVKEPLALCASLQTVDGRIAIVGGVEAEDDVIFQLGVFRFISGLAGTEPFS